MFLEGDPGFYSGSASSPAGRSGFTAPSVRIPAPAFQVATLPGYDQTWMTGALVYPDVWWRHDARGAASGALTGRAATYFVRPMGNVNLPTPVALAGGAICLLGGYLVGVLAGPDTASRTTATVASYDDGLEPAVPRAATGSRARTGVGRRGTPVRDLATHPGHVDTPQRGGRGSASSP